MLVFTHCFSYTFLAKKISCCWMLTGSHFDSLCYCIVVINSALIQVIITRLLKILGLRLVVIFLCTCSASVCTCGTNKIINIYVVNVDNYLYILKTPPSVELYIFLNFNMHTKFCVSLTLFTISSKPTQKKKLYTISSTNSFLYIILKFKENLEF